MKNVSYTKQSVWDITECRLVGRAVYCPLPCRLFFPLRFLLFFNPEEEGGGGGGCSGGVLFCVAKSSLRLGSCVRFCRHNILFLWTFPLVSVQEFRCFIIILLANSKLTFGEESAVSIGTIIFRWEVIGQFHWKLLLPSEITKAEAIVVETVKGKTSELKVIWFRTHF